MLLVDMNLSPEWVEWLAAAGISAVHWSVVGDPRAADSDLMAWAAANEAIVFTHDLDFGHLLAATHAGKPSVIQVRSQDTAPQAIGQVLLDALGRFAAELQDGALVVVEPSRNRVRLLPL